LEEPVKKNLLLFALTTSVALVGGAALAQSSPQTDWSGPYIGLNGGYNWDSTTSRSSSMTVNQLSGVDAGSGAVTVPPTTFAGGRAHANGSGFMGGGQLGLNIQTGGLVWGIEGDFDGLSARGRQTSVYALGPTGLTNGSTVVARRQVDPQWVATVRGRLGLGLDRMLLYGTGGVAFANLRDRASYSYAPAVTSDVTTANPGTTYGPYASSGGASGVHTGWTAGGGVEFMASRNVTFGAEYRHTEIGAYSRTFGSTAANGVSERSRLGFTDDAVLARVNLKFSGLHAMF
jgi:outer membrane immunogenic protein